MSYGLKELYGMFLTFRVLTAARSKEKIFTIYYFKEEKVKTRFISV